MKTQTSKRKAWLQSLALIPLFALLLFSFSNKQEVAKSENLQLTIKKNEQIIVNETIFTSKDELSTILNELTSESLDRKEKSTETVLIKAEPGVSMGFITDIGEILQENGFSKRIFGDLKKPNAGLEKQDGATRKQLAEYNKLAKKYNSQSEENRFYIKKEVVRMEYLYSIMTKEQRAAAEPFPTLAPMPEPPPPPAPAPKVYKGKVSNSSATPPPPPPISPDATAKEKKKYEKVIEEYFKKYPEMAKQIRLRKGASYGNEMTPPPPPPPVSPIIHLEKMIKKGAIFYIDNKKVSSKEAKKFVRSNETIHVRTIEKGKTPKVYLSKKAIPVKKKAKQVAQKEQYIKTASPVFIEIVD